MVHVSWFPWFCVHTLDSIMRFPVPFCIACMACPNIHCHMLQYKANSNTCPQQPRTQCYHLHSGIQSNQSRLFKTRQNKGRGCVFYDILDLGSALSIYELQCASVVKFSLIKGFYKRTPPFQRFMQCWIRYWYSHFENGRRGMSLAHSQIYHFQHNKLHCLKLALIKITLVKKNFGRPTTGIL